MTASSYDSARAVRFDLPRGAVRTRADDARVVLVPSAALAELVRSCGPEATEAFGRALGAAVGARVASRMVAPQSASVEEFAAQWAGECAVAGLGLLGLERWGRALVVVVEESPLPASVLPPFVASAVEAATGRKAACLLLSKDDRTARLFVGSEASIARVKEWIGAGTTWGEAMTKLHGGRA